MFTGLSAPLYPGGRVVVGAIFFGKVSAVAFAAGLWRNEGDMGMATWGRDREIFSSSPVIRAPYRGVILATG